MISDAYKKLTRRAIDLLLYRIGYKVVKIFPDWDSYPNSIHVSNLITDTISKELGGFFEADPFFMPPIVLKSAISEFNMLIRASPVRQMGGGNSYVGALFLFLAVKAFNPSLIVESGVFQGFSSWILRSACPEARIICFDVALHQLRHRTQGNEYIEDDFANYDFGVVNASRSICFFDDHVSQGKRVIDAETKGFRHILFDDDLPFEKMHSDGWPAFPTISMIHDKRIADKSRIEWVIKGNLFIYNHDREYCEHVKSLIRNMKLFPTLGEKIGYNIANITYVCLL